MFWSVFFGILAALIVWNCRKYWGQILILGLIVGTGIVILIGGAWGVIALNQHYPGWWKWLIYAFLGLAFIGWVTEAIKRVLTPAKPIATGSGEAVQSSE